MAFTGPAMTKKEAAEAVRAAKVQLGLTWARLAEAVGRRWRGPRLRCWASTR